MKTDDKMYNKNVANKYIIYIYIIYVYSKINLKDTKGTQQCLKHAQGCCRNCESKTTQKADNDLVCRSHCNGIQDTRFAGQFF